MKKPLKLFFVLSILFVMSGCATLGLSPITQKRYSGKHGDTACMAALEGYKKKSLLRLACVNNGKEPISTNALLDKVYLTSGDTIFQADCDYPPYSLVGTQLIPTGLFYNTGVINPGETSAFLVANIWSPAILDINLKNKIDRIIYQFVMSDKAVELFPE